MSKITLCYSVVKPEKINLYAEHLEAFDDEIAEDCLVSLKETGELSDEDISYLVEIAANEIAYDHMLKSEVSITDLLEISTLYLYSHQDNQINFLGQASVEIEIEPIVEVSQTSIKRA